MSWQKLDPDLRELAANILTTPQLDVFRHRANGHSWRTIATYMHIHEATARGHHRAAERRILEHLDRKDAA